MNKLPLLLASSIVMGYRRIAPLGSDPRCEDPPNQFLTTLPEDVRSEPSLAAIKDLPSLVKSYVSAQKMIGQKRVSAPQDNWNEQQWNEFYTAVGRPEAPDKYTMPEVKLEEGLKFDEERLKAVRTELHKAGLTGKQFSAVMSFYLNHANEQMRAAKSTAESSAATAIQTLKGEWGDKYDANVDIARGVLKKFGDEETQSYIEGGMGNNIPLIRFLAKVGAQFIESPGRAGKGVLDVKDATRALQEIEGLKIDAEFQKAMGDARHPGHKAAVDRWLGLHTVAHPGKQED